jgi:hypothetical protein
MAEVAAGVGGALPVEVAPEAVAEQAAPEAELTPP